MIKTLDLTEKQLSALNTLGINEIIFQCPVIKGRCEYYKLVVDQYGNGTQLYCNHSDNFKNTIDICDEEYCPFKQPKPDSLRNLFDGAPVMAKVYHGWLPRYYKSNIEKEYKLYQHGTTSFSMEQLVTFLVDDIRLPTIEESPRNTWLCATPELIKQTEGLDCLFWCNNGGFITRKHDEIIIKDVQRFMILEK